MLRNIEVKDDASRRDVINFGKRGRELYETHFSSNVLSCLMQNLFLGAEDSRHATKA